MPSMVVSCEPSASTASTQHELTRRPSMMTLEAPQLPLLHPSLEPVSSRRSRRASRRVSRGSESHSIGSPLMVALTTVFPDMTSAGIANPFEGFLQGTSYDHAYEMPAVLGGAAHVCDGREIG